MKKKFKAELVVFFDKIVQICNVLEEIGEINTGYGLSGISKNDDGLVFHISYLTEEAFCGESEWPLEYEVIYEREIEDIEEYLDILRQAHAQRTKESEERAEYERLKKKFK